MRTVPPAACAGTLALALLFAASCSPPPSSQGPARGVVIISIDGLRPDVLLRARMPNARLLMREGSFTAYASTTDVAVTLPSHVSMLTGVTPERHGIWWNYMMWGEWMTWPAVPTLFDLAKAQGMSTALAASKGKFNVFARPGALDYSFVPEGGVSDLEVGRQAARFIDQGQPQVMLAHFAACDAAGHSYGWGSEEQLEALAEADRAIGLILVALRRAGIYERTVIILTSDHGGAGKYHGRGLPTSNQIPWLICGPGVRRGHDLTADAYRTIRTEDTFATACHVLGLPLDEDLDGRPVTQALVDSMDDDIKWSEDIPWKKSYGGYYWDD